MSNYTPDKSIMRLNFLCTKTTKQRVHLSSCKLMIPPPVERCFWEVIELTNQVTSGTLCVLWRTVTSNATLPVCSDNSQCEMHRTQKVPTPADRAEARPDSLSLDPSHFTFIVCLTGFDRPRPKLSCPWPSLSSSYLRVHQQKHKNNRAWVSSAFPQSTGWCLCAGRFGQHTHTYKTVSHRCQRVRISTFVSRAASPGGLSLPLSHDKSQGGRQRVWRRR